MIFNDFNKNRMIMLDDVDDGHGSGILEETLKNAGINDYQPDSEGYVWETSVEFGAIRALSPISTDAALYQTTMALNDVGGITTLKFDMPTIINSNSLVMVKASATDLGAVIKANQAKLVKLLTDLKKKKADLEKAIANPDATKAKADAIKAEGDYIKARAASDKAIDEAVNGKAGKDSALKIAAKAVEDATAKVLVSQGAIIAAGAVLQAAMGAFLALPNQTNSAAVAKAQANLTKTNRDFTTAISNVERAKKTFDTALGVINKLVAATDIARKDMQDKREYAGYDRNGIIDPKNLAATIPAASIVIPNPIAAAGITMIPGAFPATAASLPVDGKALYVLNYNLLVCNRDLAKVIISVGEDGKSGIDAKLLTAVDTFIKTKPLTKDAVNTFIAAFNAATIEGQNSLVDIADWVGDSKGKWTGGPDAVFLASLNKNPALIIPAVPVATDTDAVKEAYALAMAKRGLNHVNCGKPYLLDKDGAIIVVAC